MTVRTLLPTARQAVADYLADADRADLAAIVARGDGDDFPEVAVAMRAIGTLAGRIDGLERALRAYADEDFWGDSDCHAALAFHDRGAIARETLAGRDPLSIPAG